jgi:membrane protease YdiL (CAAX protease family)
MEDPKLVADIQGFLFFLLPLSVVVLTLLVWRGLSLRHAPDRNVGLGIAELIIGLMLTIVSLIAGDAVLEIAGVSRDPATMNEWDYVKLVLVSQVFMVAPVSFFLLGWWRGPGEKEQWRKLGVRPRNPVGELGMAFLGLGPLYVFVLTVTTATSILGTLMGYKTPDVGHVLLRVIVESPLSGATAILMVSAVVLAPLVEEFIYRGFVQTSIMNMMGQGSAQRWGAIVIAAGLFSLVHSGMAEWQGLPGLFVVGLVLGWSYERTGSLLTPVLVHAGFNGINVAAALLVHSPAGAS